MPLTLVDRCASFLQLECPQWNNSRNVVADPCAGGGQFLEALRQALGAEPSSYFPSVIGVEMEAGRARDLRERFPDEQTFHGDAFNLQWDKPAANVLFLNPPYDHGKPEFQFLERFTSLLVPGGVLVYVVPDRVLGRSDVVDHLSKNFTDHQAFRFPEPQYQDFKQAVLFARRAPFPLDICPQNPTWADPKHLPVLPEQAAEPFHLGPDTWPYRASVSMQSVDAQALRAAYVPSAAGDLTEGGLPQLEALFSQTTQTAMAPQPAHLALALASGRFNGIHLYPDNPSHPAILVKGVFDRISKPASLPRRGEDEKDFSWTEVEVPSLRLTILDLAEGKMHCLRRGTTPSGSANPADWTAADLLINYKWSLTRQLRRQFPSLHEPAERLPLPSLSRTPFARQREVIEAALKVMAGGRNPIILGEVGTGKTTIALYLASSLQAGHRESIQTALGQYGLSNRLPTVRRTLVLAPPHLMDGWKDEIQASIPGARVVILKKPSDIDKEAAFYLLSREKAKLSHARQGLDRCPKCGAKTTEPAKVNAKRRLTCDSAPLLPDNDLGHAVKRLAQVLFPFTNAVPAIATLCKDRRRQEEPRPITMADAGRILEAFEAEDLPIGELPGHPTPEEVLEAAVSAIRHHGKRAAWKDREPCGEVLYTSVPRPRRVSLAQFILKKHRTRFDLLIVDEAHEYAHAGSAQTIALHRLLSLGMPVIPLSGSLMNGYASGLHTLFWAFDREFRATYGRQEGARFRERYGYSKLSLSGPEPPSSKPKDADQEYGAVTDRVINSRRRLGEAPGVDPAFLFNYLLPTACSIQKEHLLGELPDATETRMPLIPSRPMDHELLAEYKRLQAKLMQQIKEDRFHPERAGCLLGALVHLPSYLDRAFEPYPIKDPVNGRIIATGRAFPQTYKTPKERAALDYVKEQLEAGERVLFFLSHTGSGLPQRWLDLFGAEGISAKFLDAGKVSAAKRQTWINNEVNDPGVPVLIVNPAAVQTGLNNLTTFSKVVWYEFTYSATIYRQANGRAHRIGQKRDVEFLVPYYAGTAQEIAVDLVAAKVSASLQFDGLDVQGALEAAGAGDDESNLAAALSIGETVYQTLEAQQAA